MKQNKNTYELLKEKVTWVRNETLRIHKISPETRIASSLSPIEIVVALYYGNILHYDPKNLNWEERDRFIVSKGHGSILMYPILADLGFFDAAELQNVGKDGTFLGGIPDPIIPGYETVNGSLGHGLGVGCGMAIGLKRKNLKSKVFVMVGDGELNEGSNWEAIMFAAHHKLDNLVLIIDNNKISMLDYSQQILDLSSIAKKFKSFNWDPVEIDGHNIEEVYTTLCAYKEKSKGHPKVIIAHTIKGHTVPKLEHNSLCHVMSLSPEEIDELIKES